MENNSPKHTYKSYIDSNAIFSLTISFCLLALLYHVPGLVKGFTLFNINFNSLHIRNFHDLLPYTYSPIIATCLIILIYILILLSQRNKQRLQIIEIFHSALSAAYSIKSNSKQGNI